MSNSRKKGNVQCNLAKLATKMNYAMYVAFHSMQVLNLPVEIVAQEERVGAEHNTNTVLNPACTATMKDKKTADMPNDPTRNKVFQ